MNTNIQSDIAAARAKLDAVSAELRALEERAKQEATTPARWEPKGTEVFLDVRGGIKPAVYPPLNSQTIEAREAGSFFPTLEAAESALPYVTFFKRLCCLAQELNPSGKVGGGFYVMKASRTGKWCALEVSTDDVRTVDCVFETESAAEQAAGILNRDGWKVPRL